MKSLLFSKRRSGLLKVFMTLIVLVGLIAPFPSTTTFAAGNKCTTSGPVSAAYTVQVCITKPSDGATVSGSRTVTATTTVTGTNPGISKLIFYLGGEYLITDYQSAYTFILPTTKWVDGSRLLEVEAIMKDGFISQRASITLNFSNGIVTPPVNTKTFTPRKGTKPPTGQAFVLAAAGDGADGATYAGNVTDLIASWSPNMFLYLGDVYDDGTATEFRNWYGTSSTLYGRFRSITNPIIGNHEYASGGIAPGYFDYWDNVPNYYSYDAAGWHFIALDSNCGLLNICGPGQAEYQWLLNDLSTHSNVCTIAYYHHPVFNVGPEGPATRMNDIWALLAQNGVDIVLNGHDHNYQRWKPLDASGAVSATGTTQFVAGAGGHGTQQFVANNSRLVIGFDTTPNAFGALRLQLNQSGASYQYVNIAGTILDSGSVTCSGAPADTTAPSTPTNLSATAVNPQLVQLTWTPSTDKVGVTGYSIYRDGSLLTTIEPTTSYDDPTVQPGTTYSYRVRAHDAAGNTSSLSSAATVSTGLLLFSDGFESGNFSQWTSVSGLTVQQQEAYAGLYGARATSTGTATYAYEQLSQTQNELYYRLWFKVISQGANSIYLQRFRTSSNGAILGVLLTSTGKLAYRNDVAGVTTTSTTVVTPGSGWHELQVRVLINGAAGATEVWLDGTRISSLSKTENLGTTPIGRIQLGESSAGRTYDVALDRVALSTQFIDAANPPEGGTLPPTNTPTATSQSNPTPTKTSTPTLTSQSSPTPTRTSTPSPTGASSAFGVGLYDDTHAGWSYGGGWSTWSGAGPINNTMHYTNVTGAAAGFTFRAPAKFILFFQKTSNRSNILVAVDGGAPVLVNAFSSTNLWQQTYTSALYSDTGSHTVTISTPGDGSYIDVDAVQIIAPPTPPGVGLYDDAHAGWSYSGSWSTWSGAGPINNTMHYTNATGATATFTFQGPAKFTLYFQKTSNRSNILISVDGGIPVSVNAFSSTNLWQQTYTSAGYLDTGAHTVTIRTPGDGNYIDVDAIQISAP